MPRRDFTGKEFYKDTRFRSTERKADHYCFIGVRTSLDAVGFFLDIFKKTDYLFELSESSLEIVINSENFVFKSFLFQDPLSNHFVLCFVNKDLNKNRYLLGGDAQNACFLLKKSKKRDQLSFSFEEEQQEIREDSYSIMDEETSWAQFKETMSNTAIGLSGEIDFLFPIKIHTYEILKPLFLEFAKMQDITYRLVFPREIEGVDALITQWEHFYEELMRKMS